MSGIGLISLLFVAQIQPGETHGTVHDLIDGRPGPKLFDIFRKVEKTDQGWSAVMEFRSPDGQVAVSERVDFSAAVQPVAYRRTQHQTGGRGQVAFADGVIKYDWKDGRGRRYQETERTDSPLVVGPMMFAYFMYQWPKVRAGATIQFRIVVPNRQTSYRFELEKVGDVVIDGVPLAKCELRLKGLYGLFVGDMVFYLDPATGDLVRYAGMVLPKRWDGDEWVPVKGLVRYPRGSVPEAGPAGPKAVP